MEKIAVIGLGYVGLPVAMAMARRFKNTVGFDINPRRIQALKGGVDVTGEVDSDDLHDTSIAFTDDEAALEGATFFIVAVPTPIDADHRPNLGAVKAATRTVARAMQPGAVVVYESTVYPGVTEQICGPLLAEVSGLSRDQFKLGYSPERINPGDREHTFEKIVKVVAAEDPPSLERVADVYSAVVDAGVHRAPSIMAAEAAKVIENTQRDLNIALMNELAIIFERIGLRTRDVLDAAGTKWNFLPFEPGLVGGHCIGVDPYYLTTMAEAVGYHPEVILAGRRINESMGAFIAQRLIKMLINADRKTKGARVGVLGLTFKPDVPDLRNTKVVSVLDELRGYGIEPMVHDPMADPEEAQHEYGLTLTPWSELADLDALILAVPHRQYRKMPLADLLAPLADGGVLIDVKSALDPASLPDGLRWWSV